ncbi:MAG: VPLPA-CTERM sorting domain-containing protein [Marinobacter sp.]
MKPYSSARRFVLGQALLAAATGVSAASITLSELPSDIQACIGSYECLPGPNSLTSLSDHQGASLFQYHEFNGNGLTQKFLVRYTLTDAYQVSYDTVTQSSGYIWLGGKTQYSAASLTHDFTLYLDQVSPVPRDLYDYSGTYGAPIHLGLNTTDLMAGGADWSIYAEEWEGFVVHENGTLLTDGVTAGSLCLAGGCGADAMFNTVFLQFMDSGATLDLLPMLNAADTRSTLYRQRSYYDSEFWASYEEQVHSVQAVPIPGAGLLLMSGLAGLIGLRRCRIS